MCDVNMSKDESNIISSAHVHKLDLMYLKLLGIRHQSRMVDQWWMKTLYLIINYTN